MVPVGALAKNDSGGARGIGLEVSRGLAEAGANVRISFISYWYKLT